MDNIQKVAKLKIGKKIEKLTKLKNCKGRKKCDFDQKIEKIRNF